MLVALLVLAQLNVTVAAPDTVRACDPFTISIVGTVRGAAPPVLAPPAVGPLTIVTSRASSQTTADVFGGRWSVTDVQLTVLTDRPGRYVVGPFEMRSGRLRTRTRRSAIVVVGENDSTAVASVVTRARIDTSADVALRSLVQPDTVYVGEQATYQVGVFVSPAAREKLRRNPTFAPPQLNALMAYDRPTNRTPMVRRRVGTQCFDVLVYERAVFPLSAGRHVLAPAHLSYSLSVGAGFFAGEERREAVSDSVAIVALDPPEESQPADFAGAVGDLSMTAIVDSSAPRVGDPLMLTVRIQGEGNVKLLPRPSVAVQWAALVQGDERVSLDSAAAHVRGSKEFDWILTPREAGPQELPPVRYPFWNPRTLRYEVATTSPETLTIAPGSLVALDTARVERVRVLTLRRELRPPASTPLPQRPAYLLALAVAPLPALGALAARRRRRVARAIPPAARLRSLARARTAPTPALVRRTLAAALIDRGVVTMHDLERSDSALRALRRSGVSAETATRTVAILVELDEASFAGERRGARDAAKRAAALLRAVDAEARGRDALGDAARTFVLTLGILTLGAGIAHAAAGADTTEDLFARGVASYDAGRYAEAAALFDSTAHASPRSADAWANAGTAAWTSADTAGAVVGWQRALRLEPLAGDVRDRLDLTPGPARGALAAVPPVPLEALAAGALALWWLAWLGAAARALGGSRPSARTIYALHGLAVAAGVGYILLDEHLAGVSLRVVVEPTRLHSEPSLATEPGAATRTGQVVRSAQRQGAWTRAVLENGDDGWIESDRLRALTGD
jgi:tetratricopeptide (TPR) repeat protein